MLAVALACGLLAADDLAPPITPDKPPEAIAKLFEWVRIDAVPKKECAALAADPFTRAYMAAAILGSDQPKGKVFNAAFRDVIWPKKDARRVRWAKDGRLDLIAEAAVVAGRADPDVISAAWKELKPGLAGVVDNSMLVLKDKLDPKTEDDKEEYAKRAKAVSEGYLRAVNGMDLGGHNFGLTYSWPTLRIWDGRDGTAKSGLGCAATADRMEFVSNGGWGLFIASAEMVAAPKSGLNLENGVLFCNGPINFAAEKESFVWTQEMVVVADGDVTLPGNLAFNSVLIARGDIHITGGKHAAIGLFATGGKVTSEKPVSSPAGAIFAKGGVWVDDKKAEVTHFAVGPADLGVRWFELADVGLEVDAKGVVTAVAKGSPFAGRLQAKDALTAINGTPVKTPDEARRALRRAVVLGSAVVAFDRAGEKRTKLVRVDDVK